MQDIDELLAPLVVLTQRYLDARQVKGQQAMEMVNFAYGTLKRLATKDAKYKPLYLKVKTFHEKARRQEPKAKAANAANTAAASPSDAAK